MAEINQLVADLSAEIAGLEDRFISKWIPAEPSVQPEEFEHDVKAFCVLTHAAFEEFAEEISLIVVKLARDAWLNKKFSKATISLLLAYHAKLHIVDDEGQRQDKVFDQIRKGLDECVAAHSVALSKNHGFSLKYLRNILTPVGIDIPEDDLQMMGSLKELTEARGSYAHTLAKRALYGQWRRAGRPMVPESARDAASDCLALCKELAKRGLLLVSEA
jgi:hypothetical protein